MASTTDPTLTLPPPETVPVSSTTDITGVSYQDSAAAGNSGDMYLRISDSSGLLSSSINGAAAPGSGTNTIILSTTYADITAALSSLAYSAPATSGFDSINFDFWNQYGTETTGSLPATITGGTSGGGGSESWVESWAAASEFPVLPPGGAGNTAPSFNNQTIRETIRISAGGSQLRLNFSNLFGQTPLTLGDVHVALAGSNGSIVAGSDHALTFGGQGSTTIAAGATEYSDPVNLPVSGDTTLDVSIYLPDNTGPVTWNQFGDVSPIVSGDQTSAATLASSDTTFSRPILSSVDVQGPSADRAIAVLGDSISVVEPDVNQNDRWTDDLSTRLQSSSAYSNVAVDNAGISGNRILADGTGPSGLSRFQRDITTVPGVKYVIVEEGVNDIGAGSSAQDIENGYLQLAAAAHADGLRIYGSTITPIAGSIYDTPANEAVRDQLNTWIRAGNAFDGYFDFAAAVQDPQNPQQWLPAYDNGSHLHPSGAGAQAMANAINLVPFSASLDPSGYASDPSMEIGLLYDGVLGRAPDAGGLNYWTGQLQSGADSLTQVAAGFMASPEFQQHYGAPDPTGLVTELYQNALGRAPDASGAAYWESQPAVNAAVGISESPEALNHHGVALLASGLIS